MNTKKKRKWSVTFIFCGVFSIVENIPGNNADEANFYVIEKLTKVFGRFFPAYKFDIEIICTNPMTPPSYVTIG